LKRDRIIPAIILDYPSLAIASKASADRSHVQVYYLGTRYQDYLSLSDAAPNDWTVSSVGERLSRTFDNLRDDFINLDEHLASGRLGCLWDGSDLAERNPFTSDFLVSCSRAVVMLEILEATPDAVFVVDSSCLVFALAAIARRAEFSVKIYSSRSAWLLCLENLRDTLGRRILQGLRWLRTQRQLKTARGGRSPRWPRLADLLMVTWCTPQSFGGETGDSPDSYFGSIPLKLRQSGHTIAWIGNATSWVRPMSELCNTVVSARDPILMPEDVWTILDIVSALLTSLAFPLAVRHRLILRGVDLSPLVRRAILHEMRSTRLSFALLYGKTIKRLAQAGLRPQNIVYLYEHQPWEKLLQRSVRRWMPGTRLVACLHAPMASRYISILPSRIEVTTGRLADRMLVIGEFYRQAFIDVGIPASQIAIAGAFRFESVFTGHQKPTPIAEPIILCPCPIEFGEALELTHKTARALLAFPVAKLLVNFHPAMNRQVQTVLRQHVASLLPPERLEFSDKPATALLPRVCCVVYNASGVVFEASRMAIPAIFIGSEVGIDLDKLPGDIIAPARRVEDLQDLLRNLFDDPRYAEDLVRANREKAELAFQPPDFSVWRYLSEIA